MSGNSSSSFSKIKKCDYLGCTGEAPFHCTRCTKYYCQEHPFHHDCNENDKYFPYCPKKDTTNSSSSIIKYGKCDSLGCTGEAPFFCSACVKHYCQEHPFTHECKYGTQFMSNRSKNNQTKKEDKKTSFNKCDFLGCTGEAPFFCKVCKKYYCERHPFNHECKP